MLRPQHFVDATALRSAEYIRAALPIAERTASARRDPTHPVAQAVTGDAHDRRARNELRRCSGPTLSHRNGPFPTRSTPERR